MAAFIWSDERPNDAPQTPLVNVMTRRVPHWVRPGRRRRQNEREFVCGHVGRVCYACPMSLISVSTTEGVLSVLFRTSAINVFIVVAGEITATHHSAAGCIRSGSPIFCRKMKGHEPRFPNLLSLLGSTRVRGQVTKPGNFRDS